MNKPEEWGELCKVFGAEFAAKAIACEAPDFFLPMGPAATLGVEVTSIFRGHADAKLKHLPNFATALLEGSQKVHEADDGIVDVCDVTIQTKDGAHVTTERAIIQPFPTPEAKVDLLMKQLRAKEKKAPAYLRRCDAVDLVISDPAHLFWHQSSAEVFAALDAFAPKSELLTSCFREIYLVTTGAEEVFFPLRCNLFAADCLALEHLLLRHFDRGGSGPEAFALLVASLYLRGYQDALVSVNGQHEGVLAGAWEIHYSPKGRAFRDWRCLPRGEFGGMPIRDAFDSAPPHVKHEAHRMVKAREGLFASLNLSLPCQPVHTGAERI